jgi:hypothetical protein
MSETWNREELPSNCQLLVLFIFSELWKMR